MSVTEEFATAVDEIFEAALDSLSRKVSWENYLNASGGEQAIARDHHGRHLLELLQNARDAVWKGQDPSLPAPGRILVGVTETGLFVANTGAPFCLNNPDTRKAVQYLGRSDKPSDLGYVGHKGIGLKSVLLQGGAFIVRSKVGDEMLRAEFSRARTARRLLRAFQKEVPSVANLAESGGPIKRPVHNPPWELLADLPRLPLFLQPHVTSDDTKDGLLLESFLVDSPPNSAEGDVDSRGQSSERLAYQTVVYIPFVDADWFKLLDALRQLVPEKYGRVFDDSRESQKTTPIHWKKTWGEVSKLDPRILMLLGEVKEVRICRYQDGDLHETIRYELRNPLMLHQRKALQDVDLTRTHWRLKGRADGKSERRFCVFTRKLRGAEEPIRVVVEVATSTASENWLSPEQKHPLSLFYPIPGTGLQLPLIVHGPFHVSSNRMDLADEDTHNKRVLDGVLELMKKELPKLASRSSPHRHQMPWLVAPRVDFGQPERLILRTFADDLKKLLCESKLVPTQVGPRAGREVLFDPERPRAFDVLPGGRRLSQKNQTYFEAMRNRDRAGALHAAAAVGLGELRTLPSELGCALEEAWEKEPKEKQAFPVDELVGKAWFDSLQDAFRQIKGQDKKAADRLAEVLGTAKIPLIPVRFGGGRKMMLVRAEYRKISGKDTERATRVVFWRNLQTQQKLPPPPTSLTVFLAEEADLGDGIWALIEYGRTWGTAQLQSIRDLFVRVANQFATDRSSDAVEVLPWLAARLRQLRKADEGEQKGLTAEPGAWRGFDGFEAVSKSGGGDAGRAAVTRYSTVQRLGGFPLPKAGGDVGRARELSFGIEWAALFKTRGEKHYAKTIESYAEFLHLTDTKRGDELAPPDDERWRGGVPKLLDVLLCLGVQIGPRVEWRWVRTVGNPATTHFDEGSLTLAESTDWLSTLKLGPSAQAWRTVVNEARHHPALSTQHSGACPVLKGPTWPSSPVPCSLSWCWFPDLETLAEDWSEAKCDAWRESLVAVWPSLQPRILETAWVCNGHHGSQPWKRKIPSLAAVQLRRSPIWRTRAAREEENNALWPADLLVRWPDNVDAAREDDRNTILPTLSKEFEPLADHLDVVLPGALSVAGALRRLNRLLTSATAPGSEPSLGKPFPLRSDRTANTGWIGSVNELTKRLWASLGAHELSQRKDEDIWRLHELGLQGGWLRGVNSDGLPVATPITIGDDGAALAERTVVFRRRPQSRDIKALNGMVALEVPGDEQAAMLRLATLLKADVRELRAPTPFPDKQDAPAPERKALAQAILERLHLVLAVLRANNKTDLEKPARDILKVLDGLVGVNSRGVDGRWSGLTTTGRLAYARDIFLENQCGAYVLAAGLAELLGQPSAVAQFDHALSADVVRFEQLLEAQGIRVELIVQEVSHLASELKRREVVRRNCLTIWLAAIGFARQPTNELEKLAVAANDEIGRRALLVAMMDLIGEALPEGFAREAAGELFPNVQAAVNLSGEAASALGQVGLAQALCALDNDVTDTEINNALSAAEHDIADLGGLASTADLEVLLRSARLEMPARAPRWLLQWSEEHWRRLEKAANAQITDLKASCPSQVRDAISLSDARARLLQVEHKARARLRAQRHEFDEQTLVFPDACFVGGTTVLSVFGNAPIEVGRSGGGRGDGMVTESQAHRGMIAEQFALEDCWRRFLGLSRAKRAEVLKALIERLHDRKGPVPWGSHTLASSRIAKIKERRNLLCQTQGDNLLRKTLLNALDISGDRGPGFDVLDPINPQRPMRVEVKAVLPEDIEPRVFLTSNEYHKARMDPSSYVLRLVAVPADINDLARVHWLMDILDPVQSLDLGKAFSIGVVGGSVGLKLKLGELPRCAET